MLCLGVPLLLLFLGRPIVRAGLADSSDSIPVPQNLTIESFNFKNKLRWSPINNGSVSYTVESLVKGPDTWEKVVTCTNIKKPECDFVPEFDFSTIIFRVRAQQGKLKSNWTETPPFEVRRHTTLGPPKNINISARADSLLISFDHPFKYTALSSPFEYLVYYWDNSTKTNLTLHTAERTVTLQNLKQKTVYCFQIEATFRPDLKGQLSAPYCKETTATDTTRILYITLIFGFVVFILIAVFLSLMAVRKYEDAIKSLWRPPLTIPFHFEEDLQNFQITTEFKNNSEEEHWDTLSVVSNAEES